MNHSTLALFAQRTRIPTSARSIGFCVIWVCISSSSSSKPMLRAEVYAHAMRASQIVNRKCIEGRKYITSNPI